MFRLLIVCLFLVGAFTAQAEIQVQSVGRGAISAVFFQEDPSTYVSDSRDFEGPGECVWDMELSGYGITTRAVQNTLVENSGLHLSADGSLEISWLPNNPLPGAHFGILQTLSIYFSAPQGSQYSLVTEGRTNELTSLAIGDAGLMNFIFHSAGTEGDIQLSGLFDGSGNYALILRQDKTSGEDGESGSSAVSFVFSVLDDGAVAEENLAWGGIKALFR